MSPPVEPSNVLLEVRNLSRVLPDGRSVTSGLSFTVRSGEILFVRGPSGVGKTLLLRNLAYLDVIDSGTVTLNGKAPSEWGIPKWRALVTYVHQSRVSHKGTPAELYFVVQQFAAQRGRPRADLPAIVAELGLEPDVVLNQPWAQLSGGQAQRVQLAIALALRPLVLLLDEPTSALDGEATRQVERVLKTCGAALVWISHDPLQPGRVGGRVLNLPLGTESAAIPASSHPATLPEAGGSPADAAKRRAETTEEQQ